MKKNCVLLMCVIAAIGIVTSCNPSGGAQTNVKLDNTLDSVSYAIGVNVGTGLGENLKTLPGGEANKDALIAGFITAINGNTDALKIDQQTGATIINQYVMAEQTKEAEQTKVDGETFLELNKTKDGVITTESGLQYKVLTEGTGAKPTLNDRVKVHYTGKLLDGTVFDSSVQGNEPATFGITQVIRGWTEILQIMPTGSKYQVWIPSELGYGAQGAGQMIKPNSVLEFEIELLEIAQGEN
jgi:FKBP-type peptidyl-prolyl cis-trans isomerase